MNTTIARDPYGAPYGAPTGFEVDNMPGGYAYRITNDGYITILRSPTGSTGVKVAQTSSAGRAILNQIASTSAARLPVGSIGSANVPAGAPAGGGGGGTRPSNKPRGVNVTKILNDVASITAAFAPTVTSLVQTAQPAGNTGVRLQTQLARKSQELARTSDPVKQARLKAEIDNLQARIRDFQGAVSSGVNPLTVPSIQQFERQQTNQLPLLVGAGFVGLLTLTGIIVLARRT